MYILVLVVLLAGAEYEYGPGGETVKFPTKAACEAQATKSKPAVEKELKDAGPFKLECRKA